MVERRSECTTARSELGSETVVPGDSYSDQKRPRGVEGDRERCGWKDSATSSTGDDSKRVATRPLARDEASQQQRHPTEYVDPPRRRGQMKTKSRKVSPTRATRYTHHVGRSNRDCIRPPPDTHRRCRWSVRHHGCARDCKGRGQQYRETHTEATTI
jgi:hypothetical protein